MRTLLALALAGSLGACASHKTSSSKIDDTEARQLLVDRNWIDHMPQTERDRIHVYRFVPSMGGGVYQDRTIFKGTFELFQFETHGDQLRFNLLETHQRVTSHFKIEKVNGPKPFDLKLTIDPDPRGPGVYYGERAETDRDGSKLEQQLHH